MTKQRIKLPAAPAITTRDEAEAVMNQLARTANNRRKFITRLDAEKLAVEEKYAANIAACDAYENDDTHAPCKSGYCE